MATNIPPHNLGELVDGCVSILASREPGAEPLGDKELFKLIPGPDFPTGSMIMGREDAATLYSTGHGGVTMRAMCHVEAAAGKGTKNSIICTELPYQVNKASLLEKVRSEKKTKRCKYCTLSAQR